jgi:hypothetical protein
MPGQQRLRRLARHVAGTEEKEKGKVPIYHDSFARFPVELPDYPPRLDDRPPLPAICSPKSISHSQKAHYQEHGFVQLDNFLSAEQLANWRCAVDAAAAERSGPYGTFPDGRGRPNANAQVFSQRVNLHQTNAEVRRMLFSVSPMVGRLCSELNDWPAGYRLGGAFAIQRHGCSRAHPQPQQRNAPAAYQH